MRRILFRKRALGSARDSILHSSLFCMLPLVVFVSVFGCATVHDSRGAHGARYADNARSLQAATPQQQVLVLLATYEGAMRRMAYDEIAELYAIDGEIVHNNGLPIKGRELIRQFLLSFSNYKVIENVTRAETTEITGNTAQQSGLYSQLVVTPSNQTVHASGKFEARWQRQDGDWRLVRMHTTSVP